MTVPTKYLYIGKSESTLKHIGMVLKQAACFKEYKLDLFSTSNLNSEEESEYITLQNLTEHEIINKYPRDFISWLACNLKTLSTFKVCKSTLLIHFMIDSALLAGIPYKGSPASESRVPTIHPSALEKIISWTKNPRDRAILSLIAGSGGRRVDEVREIRIGDVAETQDSFVFVVKKTKTSGEKFFELKSSSIFYKYFKEYWSICSKDKTKPLFPSSYYKKDNSRFISKSGFQKLVSELIGYPSHAIRRGIIVNAIKNGVPIEAVAEEAGHKSSATTFAYYKKARQSEKRTAFENAQQS